MKSPLELKIIVIYNNTCLSKWKINYRKYSIISLLVLLAKKLKKYVSCKATTGVEKLIIDKKITPILCPKIISINQSCFL